MNNKIKTISAALLAAAMCASFTGCANSETSSTGKIENSSSQNSKPNNSGQSSTASKTESEDASESVSKPEKTDEIPEITIAATDEILNASLNSGLVQFYNDVFQCGGYITVSEFIEKYKSLYSFKYNYTDEPVTDETLNISIEPNLKDSVKTTDLALKLVPKFTVKDYEIDKHVVKQAYIVNPTDKAVPLSECYINLVKLQECPFFQKALNEEIADIPEFLKGLGYEEISISEKSGGDIKPSMELNKKFGKDYYDNYWFYEVGEINAFGAKPLYKYWIFNDGKMKGMDNIGYIFE